MREITVTRDIPTTRTAVWEVLADFANIADWNSGVKTSFSTGDAVDGVGATRHCDLAPMGALEETIAEWEPEKRMVVSIDSAAKLPIKSGRVTFSLSEGDDSTPIELRYEYAPRYGPVGALMGPMIDKQLTSGFNGFLADLDAAAQKRSPAVS